MGFHHRKLLEDSIDLNATHKICDFFCIPNNIDGYCPSCCLSECSQTCFHPLIPSLQFPPTSLPDYSNPNLPHHHKSPNLHLYLSISFALFAAVLLLSACFAIYRHFRRRRSSTPPENREGGGDREPRGEDDDDGDAFLDEEQLQGPVIDHPIWYIRTVGLQPSIINAISVCKYKKSDGIVEGTECSVCLNEFEEDETLRLLPKCSHAFHLPCIDTWLRSHTNCPNCRSVIFSPPTPSPAPTAQEPAGIGIGIGIGIDTPQPTIHEESESESESVPLDRENELREEGRRIEDVQPIRRSVSASIMSAAIDDDYPDPFDANSNTQLENRVPKKVKGSQSLIRLKEGGGGGGGGPSVRQSEVMPCLGKRSVSCSVLMKQGGGIAQK